MHTERIKEAVEISNQVPVLLEQGRPDDALNVCRRAVDLFRGLPGFQAELGNTLGWQGNCLQDLGRFDEALQCYDESIAILSGVGNRRGVGNQYGNIANTLNRMGRYTEALSIYQKALGIAEEVRNTRGILNQLIGMSSAQSGIFDWPGALESATRGRNLAVTLGDPRAAQFEEFIASAENAKRQFDDEIDFMRAVFRPEGGTLDIEYLTPEVAVVYRKALSVVQQLTSALWDSLETKPPFDTPLYCYVGFESPNGWARRFGRRVVIGVSSGLVDNVLWWANTLLAHPRTFPDLGNAKSETRYRFPPKSSRNVDERYWRSLKIEQIVSAGDAEVITHLLDENRGGVPIAEVLNALSPDDMDDMLQNPDLPFARHYEALKDGRKGHMNYVHFGWQEPFCPERRTFAAYMATSAVCQAFLHELSHFLGGHLEVPSKALDRAELTSLEVEADVAAMQIACGYDICALLKAEFEEIAVAVHEGRQQRDLPYYLWALGGVLMNYMDLPFQEHGIGSAISEYLDPVERTSVGLIALVTSRDLFHEDLYQVYSGSYGAATRTLGQIWRSSNVPGHTSLPTDEKQLSERLTSASQHIADASRSPVQRLLAHTEARRSLGIAIIRALEIMRK